MSGSREPFFAEPVAYIITVACFGFFVLAMALVLGIIILPIAGVAAGGYFAFRHYQTQKLRVVFSDPKPIVSASPEMPSPRAPRYDPDAFAKTIHNKVLAYIEKDTGRASCKALSDTFTGVLTELYADEAFHVPPSPPNAHDLVSRATYQDRLDAWEKKTGDASAYERFVQVAAESYLELRQYFPPAAFQQTTSNLFTAPISIAMERDQVIEYAAWFFQKDLIENLLFEKLREQITANDVEIEGSRSSLTFETLFAGTPIAAFSSVEIPFDVPLSKQLEHSMIAAGTRYGKSQLIGSIIATHLQSDDPPGVIVIDSTGDFAEKISRIDLFTPGSKLDGRLLVLDPADAPQLNMFDMSAIRAKGYGAGDLEQVEADVINLFNYVFASVGSDLTAQQGTGFNFLVRLLLSMPGSNINTLREILEVPAKTYAEAPAPLRAEIEKLDATTQAYFRNQFFTLSMQATRQGVARRLYAIIQIPTFERMFTGANRVDFFQAMQEGKIIVVNTAKSLLQEKASALFGRYIIARVMSGAFERTVIKDVSKRRPCLLFVDEAQEYFDGAIDTMLTQIGKFKLGLCIAFQYFDQLDDKLKASVLGNTTVKYAGGLRASEARMIAREMNVDEELVRGQRKDNSEPPQWAQFATHIKYSTDRAVSLTVPFYALENMPKMTDEAHRALMAANRDSVRAAAPPAPPATTPQPQHPPRAQSPPNENNHGASHWE